MDIASMAFPPPSPLPLRFSDHSHSLFYAPYLPLPIRLRRPSPFPLPSPSRTFASSLFSPAQEASDSPLALPAPGAALAQDFAHPKARLKQKKKQLKALEKRAKRQKKLKAVKPKAEHRESSSSSSSESSDDERCCDPVHTGTLTKVLGLGFAGSNAWIGLGHPEITPATTLPMPMPAGIDAQAAKDASGTITATSTPSFCASKGTIQVCVGGKCRKAGSERLMASLKERIPSNCGVEAVPCKCMGKCAMAINVKVQTDDTNPQHHCHAGPDDANHILNRYFCVGPPPSALPSFPAPCLFPSENPTACESL